jgi:hypothetical protein
MSFRGQWPLCPLNWRLEDMAEVASWIATAQEPAERTSNLLAQLLVTLHDMAVLLGNRVGQRPAPGLEAIGEWPLVRPNGAR